MISNEMNFVIASNNIKKAKELENILYHLGYKSIIYSELMPYIQFPNEQNNSLEQNACTKAEFISNYLNNELVIADDTGLYLDAFPQEYGVSTKRQLMKECKNGNFNQYLLNKVKEKDRKMTLRSVVALAQNGVIIAKGAGKMRCKIALEELGNMSTGFDKIVIPDGSTKTIAQMDWNTRFLYLHRAIALQNLLKKRNFS